MISLLAQSASFVGRAMSHKHEFVRCAIVSILPDDLGFHQRSRLSRYTLRSDRLVQTPGHSNACCIDVS